jgi:hypothetical protein
LHDNGKQQYGPVRRVYFQQAVGNEKRVALVDTGVFFVEDERHIKPGDQKKSFYRDAAANELRAAGIGVKQEN